jgi:electron transport complex protein RnfG
MSHPRPDDRPAAPGQPQVGAVRLYAPVLGVGLACSLAIATVYEATLPYVHRQAISQRQRAVLEVIPGAEHSTPFRYDGVSGFRPAGSGAASADGLVFAGYAADGSLAGVALESQGMGYQDRIRALFGYSFDEEAVVGFRILESRETPGLGDRAASDPGFRSNFTKLDVRLAPEGGALANPVRFVGPGGRTAPWEIDGISGATVTSRAIADMLGASAALWIPRIHPRRTDFERARSEGGDGGGNG